MNISKYILILFASISSTLICAQDKYDIAIIGGGASGTAAAIHAARLGSSVLLIEETPWLGGMITSAGVSAFDGNHGIAGGIFAEFRDSLYQRYGGPTQVYTGWVSNTLFEPHVGNEIFQNITNKLPLISKCFGCSAEAFSYKNQEWAISYKNAAKQKANIKAKVLIDGTELGDVIKALNIPADIGMSGDKEDIIGANQKNDIIQDLTYVIILKDYGIGENKTIPMPKNYDKKEFQCACNTQDPIFGNKSNMDCAKMMQYGKLPNNKYMINWPNCGNDIYLNIINLDPKTRSEKLKEAKEMSLRFLYFIQHELGYKNLGIADDEYPTADGLPFIPYHRESRRVKSIVRFNTQHIQTPYNYSLYKTGIAVGDYPIDHHHKKNPKAPNLGFEKLRTPSFNIPIGSMLTPYAEKFIIAEKSIGVSNVVNGSTRLQPVVLGIGQAAGTMAHFMKDNNAKQINIRKVQESIIKDKAYVMAYIDVKPNDKYFTIIQKIGASGIIKGVGIPYGWASQTWFYPEKSLSEFDLMNGLRPYYSLLENRYNASGKDITIKYLTKLINQLDKRIAVEAISDYYQNQFGNVSNEDKVLNRGEIAVLLDYFLQPFERPIDYLGNIIEQPKK
jgi:hypothetical protein